ncbi:MAG: hypothetical protein KQ78_01263 [Candidatus Izimaplasma bacterium HR2]|nr:MAG: hypothetical protein KQ78_01263 [Candidatus Izimaplasma bacterium HR2]
MDKNQIDLAIIKVVMFLYVFFAHPMVITMLLK